MRGGKVKKLRKVINTTPLPYVQYKSDEPRLLDDKCKKKMLKKAKRKFKKGEELKGD